MRRRHRQLRLGKFPSVLANYSSCPKPDEPNGECIFCREHERENYATSAENFGFQFPRHNVQICDRVKFDRCNVVVLERFSDVRMKLAEPATIEAAFSGFVCRFSTTFARGVDEVAASRSMLGELSITAECPSSRTVSLNRSSGVHDDG
jgi:hypothetical protein